MWRCEIAQSQHHNNDNNSNNANMMSANMWFEFFGG